MIAIKLVYYAHCVALYDSVQEQRDMITLQSLGFSVLNPNHAAIDKQVRELKESGAEDYMELFRTYVNQCDVFAFRALPDGAIPAGVAKEIQYAIDAGKPIIELPNAIKRRTISLEHTREYLHDVGQR